MIVKKCYSCCAEIDSTAKFCQKCGKEQVEEKVYCTQCGVELQAGQRFCSACGASVNSQPQPQPQPQPVRPTPNKSVVRPDSHMTKAIVRMFFFWPLAIAALVNATKVESLWNQGATTEALVASRRADSFGTWSIVLGVIIPIVYFVVYFIILAACL